MRRNLQIDIIDADTGASNNSQLIGGFDQLLVNLRTASHNPGVSTYGQPGEFVFRLPRSYFRCVTGSFQKFVADGVDGVRDEDACCLHVRHLIE